MPNSAADIEAQVERMLADQAAMRNAVEHPGVKLLFQKLKEVAKDTEQRQLSLDPYSQASEIKRSQELRFVIDVLFPQVIETLVNYAPGAPDKQVAPKRRWKFLEWLRK